MSMFPFIHPWKSFCLFPRKCSALWMVAILRHRLQICFYDSVENSHPPLHLFDVFLVITDLTQETWHWNNPCIWWNAPMILLHCVPSQFLPSWLHPPIQTSFRYVFALVDDENPLLCPVFVDIVLRQKIQFNTTSSLIVRTYSIFFLEKLLAWSDTSS